MNSTLTKEDYKNLFGFAHAALSDSMKSNKPFDLKTEIETLYVSHKEDDPIFALGLVQAYPSQLFSVLGYAKELSKFHRQNGLSSDELLELKDSFENIDNVTNYLNDNNIISSEEISELKSEVIQNAKKPQKIEKPTIDEIEKETKKYTIKENNNSKQSMLDYIIGKLIKTGEIVLGIIILIIMVFIYYKMLEMDSMN